MYYEIENSNLESIIDNKIKGSFLWMVLGLVLTFSMIILNIVGGYIFKAIIQPKITIIAPIP